MFDSNVPRWFAPAERDDFARHLDQIAAPTTHYLVLVADGAIVAGGGLTVDPTLGHATLDWGMVDRRKRGQGLGTRLTQARLDAARKVEGVTQIHLTTSQHTQDFYKMMGFRTDILIPNGLAEGLDRIKMSMLIR